MIDPRSLQEKTGHSMKKFACYKCNLEEVCKYAWDLYNIGEESKRSCLAWK